MFFWCVSHDQTLNCLQLWNFWTHKQLGHSSLSEEEFSSCGALRVIISTAKHKPSSTTYWIYSVPNANSLKEFTHYQANIIHFSSFHTQSLEFNKKLLKQTQRGKKTKPVSWDLPVNRTKPRDGLDMQTLDRNYEITMITILKVLMDKVDSIHKSVG